jgi:Ca-activated chloride channel family protein
MMPFSQQVLDVRDFEIDIEDPATLGYVRDYVNALRAGGDTAIFSSLRQAYDLALAAQERDPSRHYSIVLMSDGKNTTGIEQSDFVSLYRSLPEDALRIKTFTILFGKADEETMEDIAALTGGRMFDAKAHSLNFIFKQIRGYQ